VLPLLRLRSARAVRALTLALALAAPVPARASLMLAQPPYRPKDFALIKKDGLFHVFYIPTDATEKDFGHAVSADTYYWTQLPAVLTVRDDNWDNFHVWAPTIFLKDSVYYMVYTGVTQRPDVAATEQRTGLATSTDLNTWNRLDEPVFSTRQVPWAWQDTANANNGFRDPFVMPDPSVPGRWLMYTSTFPAADTLGMIVGVSTSTGDFTQWQDLTPLWITNEQYSYNALVESPHLFRHGDLWFLVFTTNAGQPISYCVGHDPTGDVSSWVYRGRLGNMLGIDTRSWFASEYLKDGDFEYFAFANYNRVEIYKMLWTGPDTFQLFEPGDYHIRSLFWDHGSVTKGQTATLGIVATGWNGREVELRAAEKMADGSEQTVVTDNVGIPSSLPLTADTTYFAWTAQIMHNSGDTTTTQTLILRDVDSTAIAPPITVLPPPPPFELKSIAWSAPGVTTGTPVTLEVAAAGANGQTVSLEAVERLSGGGEAPLDLAALGLPSTLTLTLDTTRVTWVARIRRPSGDTTSTLALVVRAPAEAVESPPLTISVPTGPPPFTVTALSWSAAALVAGTHVTLAVAATEWTGHQATLEAVEKLSGGGEASIPIADLGLPASVPLSGDTTHVDWVARIHHASGDTTGTLELIVRSAAYPVETPALQVSEPPPIDPLDQDGTIQDRPLKIRMVRSVFGDRPTFLVEMPRAGAVRLDLFDLQGRRIRRLVDRDLPAGASVIPWDGRNGDGRAMSRGLYFARLTTPTASRTVKLVLSRPAP
jgi:hypothetical protein